MLQNSEEKANNQTNLVLSRCVLKAPCQLFGVTTAERTSYKQICFDEFFVLLWASLNVHHNYVVQNTAWSRNAALLDLFNNAFPILSVRAIYALE